MPATGAARSPTRSSRQLATLDYAPSFQMGHPIAFDFAERLAEIAPGPDGAKLDRIFFTGSGSESVDTALKIAIAYQRAIGQGTRTRVIGRERGYHGVGFGGISVGGLVNNRRMFPQLPGADHLRHTHDLARNTFVKGQPEHGAELADDLRAARRPAWRGDHRGGDRRAGGGLDRRAACRRRAISSGCARSRRSTASC